MGMREEYVLAYRHASAAGHARIMATLEEEGGVDTEAGDPDPHQAILIGGFLILHFADLQ